MVSPPRLLLAALLAGAPLLNASTPAKPVAPPHPTNAARAMRVLKANCVECHNSEKRKSGLMLTTRESTLEGGDGGVVLVPGKPKESPLLAALLPEADPHMPPKKQLSAEQIRLLRTWVQEGAIWDEAALAAPVVEELPVILGSLPDSYQPVLALALSPNSKRLAVARGSSITIYDIGKGAPTPRRQLTGPHDAVQSLAWSADGRWLAAGEYRRIWLWDAKTFSPAAELTRDLTGRITSLAFTPDHATLVAADGQPALNGIVHVWDLETKTRSSTWTAHKDTILGLAISKDGKWLATASADKLTKLWELESEEEIARLEGHTAHVLSVAFHPDSTAVATGSADREIKIWDIKTKEKKTNLKNVSAVTGLAYNADGKTLASVAEDGIPRVYTDFQAHTGTERSKGAQDKALKGVNEMLYGVAMADGKLYAGSHDGTVYVWHNQDKAPLKLEPWRGERHAADQR